MFLYWLWWAMLLTGLVASVTFLVLHRPRHWFRPASLNASGWVILIFLLYARSTWLYASNGGEQIRTLSASEIAFGIVVGIGIDLLLVFRVYTFLKFQKDHQPKLNWHERSREDAV